MPTLACRRYDTLRPVAVKIEGERIVRIEPTQDQPGLPIIAPGLVDLQINGYGGIEFNDPELTIDKVRKVALSQDPFGVTAFLATSRPIATTCWPTGSRRSPRPPRTARGGRPHSRHSPGRAVHFADDGPRGAHPRQHVRTPDWDEFRQLQDAARGHIKLLTISREYASLPTSFAAWPTAACSSPSATRRPPATRSRPRSMPARMSTHLGNGAHPMIRRHPNYIWDQLAEDRLIASLIVDGHHLPPAVVKSMVRAKTPQRVVLVSDITSMGGMPPGKYQTGLGELEVLPSGKLVPAGQPGILAGASLPLHLCVANVMRFAGVDLKTAIDMASLAPPG